MLVPIGYCGGLLYYFIDGAGSVDQAVTNGLGPTLLGLSAVALLFTVLLLVKLIRIFLALGSSGSAGRGGKGTWTPDGDAAFDADATLARYMARRSAEGAPDSPVAPKVGGPAERPTFGRKNVDKPKTQ
jgi:hypothetical protein